MLQIKGDRLDSWKEIAEYLRRDLRTVRRWEKTRGLPIHRVPGGGRSAVYAFSHEIEVWLSDEVAKQTSTFTRTSASSPASNEDINFVSPAIVESLIQDTGCVPSSSLAEHPPRSRPRVAIAAMAIFVFGASLSILLARSHKEQLAPVTTTLESPPKITFVSAILPQRDQTISIKGSGFGLHTRYMNADTPFIAIRDKTGGWAARRLIPQNWDEVTLNVESWQDSQIVVSGFSGAYGSGEWKLSVGDDVEIAIWNPQSGSGPAIYQLKVCASPITKLYFPVRFD